MSNKKLLKAILEQLYYANQCTYLQLSAQGESDITPPPDKPDDPEPDN